ncbi:fimbrial protein [Cronobacter dublinensis]|uniref:fimbrial protein n=1 Tax=Cronobacter dublinensis TaxID=413497 RepID=UPI0024AE6D03|nr:fimbrial protein [Cronobacter dublinensis]MDI6445071.1 fimbrial protein [Cronobacter dublinensis]MDK1196934.1 fimbrial protein [Cronobacter dublinensis]
MKKVFTGIVISTLFVIGSASANDTSGVLSITSSVTRSAEDACEVTLSKSSVNLTENINRMITQGDKATSITPLSMTVAGVDSESTCGRKIYDGKIAVRFVGTYDNADGTSFANTATGSDAASGIGIGLFETSNEPIDIHQPYQLKTKSNIVVQFFGLQLVKLHGQNATIGKVSGDMTVQIERL